MAEVVDLDELWESRHGLEPGEVRLIPLAEQGGLRVRLLVTASGSWPSHVEDSTERYLVLRGEVRYTTEDGEHTVGAGQMVTFAPGEAHAARIETGALSLNIDADEPRERTAAT